MALRVAIDIEANALVNPTEIWVIVCKDIDTGDYHIFREVTKDVGQKERWLAFQSEVVLWIGHNILGYDFPVLNRLLGFNYSISQVCDTLILSKLIDYPRQGHSIEDYGVEFNYPKGKNHYLDFFKAWTQELEDYCVRDVDITHKIYLKYLKYLSKEEHKPSILMEHQFQEITNELHNNGFAFNAPKAKTLLENITKELEKIDVEFLKAFPARLKLIREIHPETTKHGTLHKKDFRWVQDGDLSEFNGGPFCRCSWEEFNPSSHKQIVDVLHQAQWEPTDKTKTHIDIEREINKIKYSRNREEALDIRLKECYARLQELQKYGWKINDTNLNTLPESAPAPARLLAKRILLESRRRTLTEWLGLVQDDGRIHGKFYGIGAWTHRMAHQNPNTANIPTDVKLYGHEMRSLWRAPRNRLLVGVDAEGIQLRIFAHYINDKEFTDALVRGKKTDKTDPHSLNKRVLGDICQSRQTAKRFIYALLLGAGIGKLAEILECTNGQAQEALDRLMARYEGYALLKETLIPKDAERGYFIGLDGRKVVILGKTRGERKHLAMSGYLQNGEAIVMKMACLKWIKELREKKIDFKLVNFVHDEWQTETKNDMETALFVAEAQARALREVGKELGLNCPLEGSYWSEDRNDYNIGTNWSKTH